MNTPHKPTPSLNSMRHTLARRERDPEFFNDEQPGIIGGAFLLAVFALVALDILWERVKDCWHDLSNGSADNFKQPE